MKTKLRVLLTMLCALTMQISFAQERAVSGTVSDESGFPIPGVNVVIKGTSAGTSSDSNGAYALDVQDQNATLVFSFIGYLPTEVPVDNRSVVDVKLTLDSKSLSEVVVVGYGTVSKKNVTGAVSSEPNTMIQLCVSAARSDLTLAL